MQHPASPAVARPSCQTLELLSRAKNPSRLSRAVRAAAGEPCVVCQEVHPHRRRGLSVPRAGGQRTVATGRREERLLLRGHSRSRERSLHQRDPRANAGSIGTPKSVQLRIEPQKRAARRQDQMQNTDTLICGPLRQAWAPNQQSQSGQAVPRRATLKGVRRV